MGHKRRQAPIDPYTGRCIAGRPPQGGWTEENAALRLEECIRLHESRGDLLPIDTGENEIEEDPNAPISVNDSPPVDNDSCPLFPDAHTNSGRFVAAITVYRCDGAHPGYRGVVSPDASEETIARRWGNGTYDLQGKTADGRLMKKRTLAIWIDDLDSITKTGIATPNEAFPHEVLDRVTEGHRGEVDRLATMAREVTQQVREAGQQHTAFLTTTTNSQLTRDREFYRNQSETQATFFQSMLLQAQQMHQQTVQMMQQSHQQTVAMMQFAQQQSADANNPALLMSVLQKGLEMGQGMESDQEPWVTAVQSGVQGIKEISRMALGSRLAGAQIPRKPAPLPALPNPAPVTQKQLPPGSPEPLLTAEQIAEIKKLKADFDAKDIDFDWLLEQARALVQAQPEPTEEETEEESEEEEAESTHVPPDSAQGGSTATAEPTATAAMDGKERTHKRPAARVMGDRGAMDREPAVS